MKYKPEKRIEIIKFIRDYGEEYHRCPTVDEIRKAIKLKSLSGTWYHLEALGFAGGAGKDGCWEKNKKNFMAQWKCPTCHRDLYNDKR